MLKTLWFTIGSSIDWRGGYHVTNYDSGSSLSIDNPSYTDDGTPEFTTIKNIYFERTDSHLLDLKNFNG